jgi:inositol-phosphate phosphatase / L-galactose 1-phosphate phosphatase / histidinol-phosphatase
MSAPFGLESGLATAVTLADRAREIALRWFRAPLQIDVKADASPVTQADRSIEAMCREQLASLHPDHGIVGEEFGSEHADVTWVWVIDPIDGTGAFISGSPLWGTLIGLLHEGMPVLGVIDAPATGERWSAVRGGATRLQRADTPPLVCRTSGCTELRRARLATTSPDDFDPAQRQCFERVRHSVALCRYGGDCYSDALLASGHLDLVIEAGLAVHDYLPLVPIIEAAGGVITDWSGRRLDLHSGGDVVAAAGATLHRQALAALQAPAPRRAARR